MHWVYAKSRLCVFVILISTWAKYGRFNGDISGLKVLSTTFTKREVDLWIKMLVKYKNYGKLFALAQLKNWIYKNSITSISSSTIQSNINSIYISHNYIKWVLYHIGHWNRPIAVYQCLNSMLQIRYYNVYFYW